MHLFKSTAVSTISVAWSFMVMYLVASLLHPRLNGTSTQIDHEKSSTLSVSDDQKKFPKTTVSQVGPLNKRGKDLGLLVYFEPGGYLMPLQAAAENLVAFYTNIAINALGPWAKNAPRTWIKISWGTLGLLFTATEGTTIPWGFVRTFALEMLGLTKRGYTGMYTQNYISPTMGNAIWVSLYQCAIGRLTDPAAVGAPAKCLNPEAQAWFPTRGTPTR